MRGRRRAPRPPAAPIVLALACACLPAACGGARAQAQPPSAEEAKPEPDLTTVYDDRRAGEEAVEEVRAQLGILENDELARYVEAVGQRLARHAPGRDFTYRFQIVDQEVANAFALPGGFVFVSRGLLVLTNSEDELANVLGHEIVHVASRHAAAQQQVLRSLPGLVQFMALPSLAAYGRDQERVADRLGQGLAGLAGYDPRGMTTFLRQLEFQERLQLGASRLPGFLDTHPATGERGAVSAARADQIAWTRQPPLAATRADFLRKLDGLAVGISAAEGVFRGERFLHPDLAFTIRFPAGWVTRNTHTAVGAISRERDAQVVLESGGRGRDLQAAASDWAEKMQRQGLEVEGIQLVRLGGSPALRLLGHVPTAAGPLYAVVTWISRGDSIFRLTGLARSRRHEAIFINVARSFRPLTPELVATIQERRLRLAEARAGETLEELGVRTGNRWTPNETAVANALFATTRLEAGQLVKIAVDEPYRPAPSSQ